MAAAQACASLPSYGIYLVYEYYTRLIPLCRCEQISHPACAHAYVHLYEIRTGYGKERNVCLSCHCLCKQRFTCAGRAYHKNASRYSCAHLGKLLVVFKKVDDLVCTGNVGKLDFFFAFFGTCMRIIVYRFVSVVYCTHHV